MAKGLSVVLNVSNVDKSVEFYRNLGLKVQQETMMGTQFGVIPTADTSVVLWPKGDVAPGQAPDTAAWVSGELGKGVLMTLGVPKVPKLWEKAQAMRAEIDQPLRDQEWGGKEFTVVDPDGYVVNFTDKFPSAPPKKAGKKTAKRTKATARKSAGKGKRK